jgi:hypothetical protein
LVIKTIMKSHAGQFDTETAFLYVKLEDELRMKIPDRYTKFLLQNTTKQLIQNTLSKIEKSN